MILDFCRIYSLILYFQYTRVNGKFLGGTVSWRLLGSKVSFLGNCINDLHIFFTQINIDNRIFAMLLLLNIDRIPFPLNVTGNFYQYRNNNSSKLASRWTEQSLHIYMTGLLILCFMTCEIKTDCPMFTDGRTSMNKQR